jgi:hypothetical protein
MSFSSKYSFGYAEQLSLPDRGGGTGLSNALNLALSGIRYKKIYISTSANFSRIDNLSGDLWSKSKSFSTSVRPGYWKKYGKASGSYSYSTSDDWQSSGDYLSHALRLNASTRTFRKTMASAGQNFRISKQGRIGSDTSRSMSTSLRVSHGRLIKGGKFSLSTSYTYRRSEAESSIQSASSLNVKAAYKRSLLRRIKWTFNSGYFRHKDIDAGYVRHNYYFRNLFRYRIRAWSMHVTQIRSVVFGDSNDTTTDDRFTISLGRQFGRIF